MVSHASEKAIDVFPCQDHSTPAAFEAKQNIFLKLKKNVNPGQSSSNQSPPKGRRRYEILCDKSVFHFCLVSTLMIIFHYDPI